MSANLYRARSSFEKECLASLAGLIKGSGWKKSSSAVFQRRDEYFLCWSLSVYFNGARTTGSFTVKPMELDPIYWEILGLQANMSLPLSFRHWGAFTCSALPVCESDIEVEGDTPALVARKFFELVQNKSPDALRRIQSHSFTEQLRQHPNQVERGAYAIPLVVSLINDKDYEEAERVASGYATGKLLSCLSVESDGKSFHEHALAWLSCKQPQAASLLIQ